MIKKINAQEIDFRTRNEERLKNEESLNDSINEILEYMFMNFLQNYFPSIMEKNMSKLLETKNMGKYLSERVLLTKEDLIELRFDKDDWNFNLNEKVSNIKFQDNKYISRDKFIKYVIERFSLYGINCKEDYIVDNPKLYFEDLERLDRELLNLILDAIQVTMHIFLKEKFHNSKKCLPRKCKESTIQVFPIMMYLMVINIDNYYEKHNYCLNN